MKAKINTQSQMKGVENSTPEKARDLQEILLEVQMALSGTGSSEKLSTAKKLELTLSSLLQLVPSLSAISLEDFISLLNQNEELMNKLLNKSKSSAGVRWI